MTMPDYQPAAVLDIVSFGYKKLFQSLWPLTKLTLPFVIFASVTGGYVYGDLMQLNMADGGIPTLEVIIALLIYLFGHLLLLYTIYSSFRYARDLYCDKPKENIYSYLIPDRTLGGLVGISLGLILIMIPIYILVAVGLFLLILPGLAMLGVAVFVAVRLSLAFTYYITSPGEGIVEAFRQSWQLTKGNFWRTFAMGLIVSILSAIISMPFYTGEMILELIGSFNPSATENIFFPIFASVVLMIYYWGQFVLATNGGVFVQFRYLFDLEARKRETLSPVNTAAVTPWSPPKE